MKNTMRLSTESLMEICRQCFPPRIGEQPGRGTSAQFYLNHNILLSEVLNFLHEG
ncbi:hypothetical protein BRADI_4g19159v3 [Brachypodium distachyon]|uniref:Uncharacterized protein n=1 Tax=Brachypodium distachyon TaxID=15368 RepID=A0A2K2CNQ0_BRADI|nr:hypothetical protein BRADI_4g19159v3 [Brachypodium distachyon]